MLYSFRRLLGAPVMATDGVAGHVHDAILDDQNWQFRHLLVRLPEGGGHAMLTMDRILSVRPDQGGIVVSDARQVVGDRQAAATDLAVSERAAIAFQQAGPSAQLGSPEVSEGPNLRSCRELAGYWLVAPDGDIGEIEDLIVESERWGIAGICFRHADTSRLLPMRCIHKACWRDRILVAAVTAAFACQAPAVLRAGDYDADALRLCADQAGPGPDPRPALTNPVE